MSNIDISTEFQEATNDQLIKGILETDTPGDMSRALAFVNDLHKDTLLQDITSSSQAVKIHNALPGKDKHDFLKAIVKQTEIPMKELLNLLFFEGSTNVLETISSTIIDFPNNKLLVPPGYIVKTNELTKLPEIIKFQKEAMITVAPVAAFPIRLFIPKAGATLKRPELYQLIRYNPATESWEEAPQVFKKSYLCHAGNIHNLADAGFSVGSSNAKELATFFQLFLDTNAQNIDVVETVKKFGWNINKRTNEKTFAPFSGSYAVLPASGELTEQEEDSVNDYERVKVVKGSFEGAQRIVQELSNNQVFLTMLAAVLAGPVVSLAYDHLAEGIGIDLAGKTSKGKTSIQKIAFNLVYGDSTSFVRSWDGATSNGVWGIADKANHLPFILDDSHHIKKKVANLPHALLNGVQGDKQEVAYATNEIVMKDNKSVKTVILFNGEVRLSDHTVIANSRGLLGRAIMIVELPFPRNYTSEQVTSLLRSSSANRGQFRDKWLRHLAQLDSNHIISQIIETEQYFAIPDSSSVYQRLTKKAATLLWSLKEANKVLDLGLDCEKIIPFLIKHMDSTSSEGDIVESLMRELVEYVIQHSSPGESCHPFTQNLTREGYNNEADDFFLVKKKTIEKVLAGRHKADSFLDDLIRDGYLTTKQSVKKTIENETGHSTSTSGYEFKKQVIRDKLQLEIDIPSEHAATPKPLAALVESEEGRERLKVIHGDNTNSIKASKNGARWGN